MIVYESHIMVIISINFKIRLKTVRQIWWKYYVTCYALNNAYFYEFVYNMTIVLVSIAL